MSDVDLDGLKAKVEALLVPVAGSEAGAEAARIIAAARGMAPADAEAQVLAWSGKRAEGAPLGLVLGRQPFLGVELLTGSDVLAAREETEILGREVLAALEAAGEGGLRMIDMGCGSGNLGCAVAVLQPRVRVWASDLTESCAALTRENVGLHGLEDRVQVSRGDLFEPLKGRGLEGTMDVVAMNPPYIPSTSLEKTHAGLLRHEPREAFDGGPYGISIVSRFLQEAPAFLKPGGRVLFEFGLGQARLIQALVAKNPAYAGCRFATDAAGEARVAVLTT
ncbi:class I SAM-dependent methyltransferase [Geothrix sp. 21YS21S-2]|uniref:N5-glutamine methyltransferase family protein n=1 Tax=Geothrix sp. 21YS21S-2 TaxID=3068893 RepID=UPI0027BAE9FC|nr:class I SAM-dependent methyltransferase [Geothrix sp. 21YS21S-2]